MSDAVGASPDGYTNPLRRRSATSGWTWMTATKIRVRLTRCRASQTNPRTLELESLELDSDELDLEEEDAEADAEDPEAEAEELVADARDADAVNDAEAEPLEPLLLLSTLEPLLLSTLEPLLLSLLDPLLPIWCLCILSELPVERDESTVTVLVTTRSTVTVCV
jgi:hypothetical protein